LLCPEGAATLAAAQSALDRGLVERDANMVLFNCGSGLKYPLPDPARSLDRTKPITPDMLKG
jgi:threonine synthase